MPQRNTPTDDMKAMAKLITIVVRNEMETLHSEHLSDAQMRELNPLLPTSSTGGRHLTVPVLRVPQKS